MTGTATIGGTARAVGAGGAGGAGGDERRRRQQRQQAMSIVITTTPPMMIPMMAPSEKMLIVVIRVVNVEHDRREVSVEINFIGHGPLALGHARQYD